MAKKRLISVILVVLLLSSFVSADWVRVSNVTTGAITNNIYICNSSTICGFNWSDITSKPYTLLGYNITDAYTILQVDSLISGVNLNVQSNYTNLNNKINAVNSSLGSYVLITDYDAGQLAQNTTINSKIDSAYGNATYYPLNSNPSGYLTSASINLSNFYNKTEVDDQQLSQNNSFTALVSERVLNASLTTETSSRVANDSFLSSRVDALNSTLTTLNGSFTAEVSQRVSNDSLLQSNIDSEASMRVSNDSEIRTDVSNRMLNSTVNALVSERVLNSTLNSYATLVDVSGRVLNATLLNYLLITDFNTAIGVVNATISALDSYAQGKVNNATLNNYALNSVVQSNYSDLQTQISGRVLNSTLSSYALISYVDSANSVQNTTINLKAGVGNCSSGMVIQNITSSGVECVIDQTGSGGSGDGTGGWTNTSTNTSTDLDVFVNGNFYPSRLGVNSFFIKNDTFTTNSFSNSITTGSIILNNTMMAFPYIIGKGYSFDKVSIIVRTADVGTSCNFALYNDTGTIFPNALLLNYTNFSLSPIGLINYSLSSPLKFKDNSLYWEVFWCKVNNTNARIASISSSSLPSILGVDINNPATNSLFTNIQINLNYNGTFPSIFPSTSNPLTSPSTPLVLVFHARTDLAGSEI